MLKDLAPDYPVEQLFAEGVIPPTIRFKLYIRLQQMCDVRDFADRMVPAVVVSDGQWSVKWCCCCRV
jgi:hypothetical protein